MPDHPIEQCVLNLISGDQRASPFQVGGTILTSITSNQPVKPYTDSNGYPTF